MGTVSGVHMALASCIGCGCTDRHACVGDEGPCSWIVVDYDVGRGVCSCCQSHLARWNAGERSVLMLVAKVTKDGEAEPFYIEKNAMGSFPYFLDVAAGDKFSLEWVEMPQEAFEALPQFEHVRLAGKWLEETNAAVKAEADGRKDESAAHQAEAQRLALAVAELGFDVYDLVDLDELPVEFLPA